MNERAAFEQSIDENPTEATTHHAYADWLEENGHHNESEFRRSMANWHQNRDASYSKNIHDRQDGNPVSTRVLPKGVHHRSLPVLSEGWGYRQPHHLGEARLMGSWSSPGLPHYDEGGWSYHFPTYRHMEQAFRHSFMTNRQPDTAEQMSRRVRARKMSRRGF